MARKGHYREHAINNNMRAYELFEQDDNTPDGTYAGVKLSDETVERIVAYCDEHDIPNPVPSDKLHVTLLYSRKYLPDYEAAGEYKKPMVGEPAGFDVWDTSDEEPSRCLVLKLDCERLLKRHEQLMNKHEATYDHDEYTPHVTFSYNIEDYDESDLPKIDFPIELVKEYQDDLQLDGWIDDNT